MGDGLAQDPTFVSVDEYHAVMKRFAPSYFERSFVLGDEFLRSWLHFRRTLFDKESYSNSAWNCGEIGVEDCVVDVWIDHKEQLSSRGDCGGQRFDEVVLCAEPKGLSAIGRQSKFEVGDGTVLRAQNRCNIAVTRGREATKKV